MGIRPVENFYVHDHQTAGCTVVSIRGELDAATAPVLRSYLDSLVEDGRTRLVLDLAGLEFMDASGVGVLARTLNKVQGSDGWTRLVHVAPNVRRVLRITRLTEALPAYSSTAQAVADDRPIEPLRGRAGRECTSTSNT